MRGRGAFLLLVVAFLSLVSTALAATPASFCKCTCFSNSTIIPLDSSGTGTGKGKTPSPNLEQRKPRRTCNDCNRQFCLSYNLDICKNAKEEDVFTTCFQRDSTKDQAVVVIFITATVGLLVYAGIRPWIDRWAESTRQRQAYIPVSNQDR